MFRESSTKRWAEATCSISGDRESVGATAGARWLGRTAVRLIFPSFLFGKFSSVDDFPSRRSKLCRRARSSTWAKVASASNRWRTWLSTHEARRVEVERAKRRGCLTRSKSSVRLGQLAQLVRYLGIKRRIPPLAAI